MGDRGNIAVIDRRTVNEKKVVGYTFLYTHWGGGQLRATLARALGRHQRWDDGSYLTRIIFGEMLHDSTAEVTDTDDLINLIDRDLHGETGFGISAFIGDNEHTVLLIDPDRQRVLQYKEEDISEPALEHTEPGRPIKSWSFEEFIAYAKAHP